MRPRHLEVEELLRVDLGELLGVPDRARKPAASDAPWPPSFQPRNAQIEDRPLERRARSEILSSSAIGAVYVRTPARTASAAAGTAVTSATAHAQTAAASADVDQHEPPGKLRPVLELADAHLHEQQEERRRQRRA